MHVNYVAILVAAVVQWLLGALWYGLIFRKSWRALAGIPEGQKAKDAIFPMIVHFVACLLLSFALAHIVEWAGTKVFAGGGGLGVICWGGFIAPILLVQHIWERRRVNLFAINVGYWLLVMAIGGAIVAAFH